MTEEKSRDEVLEGFANLATALNERIDELENILCEIGEYSHDRSTGPAVPDELWHVRDMAYRAFEDSAQTKQRINREVKAELDWARIEAAQRRR